MLPVGEKEAGVEAAVETVDQADAVVDQHVVLEARTGSGEAVVWADQNREMELAGPKMQAVVAAAGKRFEADSVDHPVADLQVQMGDYVGKSGGEAGLLVEGVDQE